MSLSLLLLLVLFNAYFIVYKRMQIIKVMRKRINGLNDIVYLRRLIEYMPQHRGMANALLLGDESFKAKITSLDQKIDKEVKALVELVNVSDRWEISAQVVDFSERWDSLKRNLANMKPVDSFQTHTELVTILLHLMSDVGDAANILTTQDVAYAKLADATLQKLPLMSEMLGQARGMGTGVASKGVCDTNMRVKLTYLLNTARRVANEVCVDVKSALASDKKLEKKADNDLQQNKQATEYFLNSLEKNIINAETITLTSTDYYNAGTEAIQHTFILLDNIYDSMLSNLNAFERKLSSKVVFIKISSVLVSFVAVYLYVA